MGSRGGLMKLVGISPALQKVVGESTLSRAEITKRLWAYIKANNLQDPARKRDIICDSKLKDVFEKDRVGMLEMTKLIQKHLHKTP